MAYVNLLQVIYPIGAIYQSTSATSPASIIGGTWSAIQNRFLVGAGGSYKVNATGGETSHTLTINEMPRHKHAQTFGTTNAVVGAYDDAYALPERVSGQYALSVETVTAYRQATQYAGGGLRTTICHPTTEFISGEEQPSIRGDVSWLTSISYKLSILSVLIISQLQQLAQHLLWAGRGVKSAVEDSYVRLVTIIKLVPQAVQQVWRYLLTNFPHTGTKFKRTLLVTVRGNNLECGSPMLAQEQVGQSLWVEDTPHLLQESPQRQLVEIYLTKIVRHILSLIFGDVQPNLSLVGGVA